jgi:hypothetical protein|nr:MAG TPA: protein of unknown function DUF1937 [Caudoviricetes sp.]
MSVDKFNSEGYYDPTAYEAMSTVEKEERALRAFRPIVYICSPYAGEIEKNVKAAQKYSRFAVEKGYIPISAHPRGNVSERTHAADYGASCYHAVVPLL